MSTSQSLKEICGLARPMIEQQLDLTDQIAAIRDLATVKGLDWSQIKALLKAQIQDERDDSGDGKRVNRIVEKAEFASAYADMLGLAKMNEKNYFAGDEQEERSDPLAAIKADPAMAIVEPANLKNSQAKASKDGGTTGEAIEQPADSVTGDASRVSGGAGTVASIQPETADETAGGFQVAAAPVKAEQPGVGEATREAKTGTPLNAGVTGGESAATMQGASEATEAHNLGQAGSTPAPATKYAAPGVITWENHPPEGVERSVYSIAFSNMGQDPVLIQDELANGKAQPIVKQGNIILDGWARYMIARNMREMDGTALSYAVVQYDGNDVLMDVIRWNVQGRVLTETQRRAAAQMLSRQPEFRARKAEIYAAMELGMELVQ